MCLRESVSFEKRERERGGENERGREKEEVKK
jgi:hypothetical protein